MRHGFTLVEILVVMAIISILTALSLPAIVKARAKAASVKTRAVITALEAALSMYEHDCGDYPPGDGSGSKVLVEALQGPLTNPEWDGPYMRFKGEDTDSSGEVMDTWKNPLFYTYPQSAHTNTPYTIVSSGPDGIPGTQDDIPNW